MLAYVLEPVAQRNDARRNDQWAIPTKKTIPTKAPMRLPAAGGCHVPVELRVAGPGLPGRVSRGHGCEEEDQPHLKLLEQWQWPTIDLPRKSFIS